jgi:myo-inositol-1(or 4)-monophosphatase
LGVGSQDWQVALRRPLSDLDGRWLACAHEAARAGRVAVMPLAGTETGRRPLGRGGGGDITIELDRAAEEAVMSVISREAPVSHNLVCEERGITVHEDATWWVLVDPVDGSLNAKRGLAPFSVVIAVADGPTVADVRVSYTQDYTSGRVVVAVRGNGIAVGYPEDGGMLPPAAPALPEDDRIEIVLLEAGPPAAHGFTYRELCQLSGDGRGRGMRVRQIGSLALCLCYVGLGVADVLLAPVPSRAVDIAAGLRLVLEAGGGAAALNDADLWAQPLDLERRTPFVAWRPGLDGREVLPRARAAVKAGG